MTMLGLIGCMAALCLTACNSGGTITDPTQVVFPESGVSYVRHVKPFLALSCAFSGCHGDIEPAGGIRLTSYTYLFIDRPNLVVSGRPDESLIIQILDQRIPHRFDIVRNVTSAQIRGMRTWISEGALNN